MADKGIKFSVVIAAYNAGQSLEASIRSCLDQTYPPYEIIVVDDGSNDNTGEVAKRFDDAVRYIRLAQNNGPSVARNTGWNTATGDFITFQDSDDIWHPQKLSYLNELLATNPNIEFVFHPFVLDFPKNSLNGKDIKLERFSFARLLLRNVIGTPCVAIKRNIDERFEPSMRHMEDYDLWLRISFRHKIWRLNEPLTKIGRPVLSAGGHSSDIARMRAGERNAYRRLNKLHPGFILLQPLLQLNSIAKHMLKKAP